MMTIAVIKVWTTYLTTSTVMPLEIATLTHKTWDHTMKGGTLITEVFGQGFAVHFLHQ